MRLFSAALAALVVASAAITPIERVDNPLRPVGLDYFPKQRRGKGQNNRRGSGKSNPPKSRPNRAIISKRVRRKHRRAAA